MAGPDEDEATVDWYVGHAQAPAIWLLGPWGPHSDERDKSLILNANGLIFPGIESGYHRAP